MSRLINSPLPIVLLVIAVGIFILWRDRRRQSEMIAFAAAHGMRYSDEWPLNVPVPEIATLLFRRTPACSNVVDGLYRGAHVLSFDFSIGGGRSRHYGSGVAIHGIVSATNLPPLRNVTPTAEGDWTYLTTKVGVFRPNRSLKPQDIERLWDALISASVKLSKADHGLHRIPGGIHIPPRHKNKEARS
jgi:hypothetical protein